MDRPIYAPCPVPWCDSENVTARVFDARRRKHWLQCAECGFQTPQMPSRAKAERMWNTRRLCQCIIDDRALASPEAP